MLRWVLTKRKREKEKDDFQVEEGQKNFFLRSGDFTLGETNLLFL